MTISAWDIYWVMQLDSIVNAMRMLAAISGVLALITLLIGALEKSSSNNYPEHELSKRERARGVALHKVSKISAVPFVAFLLLASFLPSSKTAAAMVIVPAIANNETIRKEAGDLYALAKQGLAELVKPDAPEKSK